MTQPENQTEPEEAGPLWKRLLLNPYVTVSFAMFCWATTTVVVRYVRDDAPPMALSFWRLVFAFLILLPITYPRIRRQIVLVKENWKTLALLAMLLWFGGNALLFLSLQYTIAINAAVINSVEPVIIVFLAWLLFRDQFTGRQALGAALSLGGVLVLIAAGSIDRLLKLDFNLGDIIVFVAYIAWGFYAVLIRKLPREMDSLVVVTLLLGFGIPMLLGPYLVESFYFRAMPFNAQNFGTIAYLGIFSGAISMVAWNYGIKTMGPIRASQFLHLIPAFTVVLAIMLLDETLQGYHFVGIVLIAIGIFLASRAPK